MFMSTVCVCVSGFVCVGVRECSLFVRRGDGCMLVWSRVELCSWVKVAEIEISVRVNHCSEH